MKQVKDIIVNDMISMEQNEYISQVKGNTVLNAFCYFMYRQICTSRLLELLKYSLLYCIYMVWLWYCIIHFQQSQRTITTMARNKMTSDVDSTFQTTRNPNTNRFDCFITVITDCSIRVSRSSMPKEKGKVGGGGGVHLLPVHRP